MKNKKPILAVFVSVLGAALAVFLVFFIQKITLKENKIVKADKEINAFLEKETEFDAIIEFIEANDARRRFLGTILVDLSQNEEKYVINFEDRYPRYKAYRDMVKEMARNDYSSWVAGVISGEIETEFETNVFEYLSSLEDDDRYLDEAIVRFGKTLEAAGDKGFSFSLNRDAYIAGALGIYVSQFPESSTQILKTLIGEKIGSFIDLDSELTAEIAGMPLNKFYLYLYFKYFGIQDYVDKKMAVFMAQGKTIIGDSGRYSWSMSLVRELVRDLSSIGKGISQNFYSLFQYGFSRIRSYNQDDVTEAAVYVYIALQVLKDIGFDDPVLHSWLNRSYMDFEKKLVHETIYGSSVTVRDIVFSDEVRSVRSAINGKSDTPFEVLFRQAVEESAKTGRFIIPRVSAEEEARKELRSNSDFYTRNFIIDSIKTWRLKNELILITALISLFAAFVCILRGLRDRSYSYRYHDRYLNWVSMSAVNLFLFYVFWNRYNDLTEFQILPLVAFIVISVILQLFVNTTAMLERSGTKLWRKTLLLCAAVNTKMKRFDTANFYYNAADIPLDKRINALIAANDLHQTFELLKANNDYNLSLRIINNNLSFFNPLESAKLESLFKDRLAWIEWLKSVNRNDDLEKIRKAADELITNGIPDDILMDDNQYSDFITGLTAFDYTEQNNKNAITNIINNTLVQRCNNTNIAMPIAASFVIDKLNVALNPSALLAMSQKEGISNAPWIWNRMEKDAQTCDNPDNWFNTLIIPLNPEKFQKTLIIDKLLNVIRVGFLKCKDLIPVLILLIQAKEYIDKHQGSYNYRYSAADYNRIVEEFKKKIEKAQKQLQKKVSKEQEE